MTGVFFDWGVIPIFAVAVLTLVLVIRSFYHLVLHPLAKIPGPKVYALSDIPFLFHLLRGEWPFVLKNLHDQYGPVVRYSPRDVSIITVDGWKKIYGHKNDSAKNFEKDHLLYDKPSSGHHTIMTVKNEDHKRMRRLLLHAFSETALRNQETVIKSYIDLFISRMTEKAKAKDTIDLVQWFNFTTFDLIGDLTFGEPFGCLEKETYHPWVSMIFSSVRFTVFLQLMLRYPSLQILATLLVPERVKKAHEEHW
ncbi:hypothetical protein PFICI_15002 [Pestalotiopsis fici W106-1]|uniref:Uncharacterized protein n=1 Tax=Pestalotiopsis fici (strain W106-1 / CGMCC3.15140) TaxID=1229662 RepID=W3WJS8_PESFW|nr:uncharacterized protein PFICI_15002 [Pestalotiopsis fici W106-1]ETS73397.1 hypothetical protein PFICI_15002 [Pestalotiopsis fici W106-1]